MLFYDAPSAGKPHHLATELRRMRSDATYRSAAPALQDAAGRQIPFIFVDTTSSLQHVQGGKIRATGIANPKLLSLLKDVATLDDQDLKGLEAYTGRAWSCSQPRPNLDTLAKALRSTLATPKAKARLEG